MKINEEFLNPPKEYSLAPFWFWNDELDLEHLKWQMDQMISQGVYEIVISSRLGIEIEYLSKDWFERIQSVTRYANQIGMFIWIYDEDNWPSGYAGGRVIEENSEYCGKHLIENDKESGYSMKENKWNPAYSKGYYVDVLKKDATRCFVKHTHEQYKAYVGEYFGTTIKGFFVDEPGFYNNLQLRILGDEGSIPWNDEVVDYYRKRNNQELIPLLPHLWNDINEETKRIRQCFYETIGEMYQVNYLAVLKEFCENHQMELIGHLHYEEFLHYHIATQGNFMEALKQLNIVGVDRIDTNADKIAEKYVSSAGHMYNSKRIMSETYALSGWELTLQDMKRWLDYQAVRGITMLVPHAFYSSIEGLRKEECPPSEFYQNPYWEYFHYFASYSNRLLYLLSQGKHSCKVALYYPIASAQSIYKPTNWEPVIGLDKKYQDLAMGLLEEQIDYDIITKEAFLGSKVKDKTFAINKESYEVLIFSQCIYLSKAEIEKIIEVAEKGVLIIFADMLPKCDDEKQQEVTVNMIQHLLELENVYLIPSKRVEKSYTFRRDIMPIKVILLEWDKLDIYLEEPDSQIRYLHREIENEDYYMIHNESNFKKNIVVLFRGEMVVEDWNLESGRISECRGMRMVKSPIYMGADPEGMEYIVQKKYPYTRVELSLAEGDTRILKLVEGVVESTPTKSLPCHYVMPLDNEWQIQMKESCYCSPLVPLEILGEGMYSGSIYYRQELILPKNLSYEKVWLRATKVKDCLAVTINNQLCGERVWEPFQVDVTHAMKQGKNEIELKVTNSVLNELRNAPRISGLLGIVEFIFESK